MKAFINGKIKALKEGLYGESLFTAPILLDRQKYSGRGRPKKTDYMTVGEAQRIINENHNLMLKGKYLYDKSR